MSRNNEKCKYQNAKLQFKIQNGFVKVLILHFTLSFFIFKFSPQLFKNH